MFAGSDSTILFESYHATPIAPALLEKYAIGRVTDVPSSFFFGGKSDFYNVLKQRVLTRLRRQNLSRRGGLLPKALIIITGFVLGLSAMCLGEGWVAWAGAVLWGLACTHIGLSIMHDGNHGAFSNVSWINKVRPTTPSHGHTERRNVPCRLPDGVWMSSGLRASFGNSNTSFGTTNTPTSKRPHLPTPTFSNRIPPAGVPVQHLHLRHCRGECGRGARFTA